MSFIPETTIEEILSRIDIVELISGYIPLKRLGRNYKALCPFHSEKTPSFVVSSERQIYHCFGCSAGGNAIGFLIAYEHLQFPEALEVLAKKAGVALPQRAANTQSPQNQSMVTQLYAINEIAANFYFNQLLSPQGQSALEYLKKRGITKETIQKFKIGYAPSQWDSVLKTLRNKNFPLALIEKAGLIIAKEGGGYYDRFRSRLIIPIFDTKERVVAFGGRVLPAPSSAEGDQGLPKYINCPETPVYSKSKILFGLPAALEAIRLEDAAIIVEGYFDQIMPYQAGIKNIVASCGTALTLEHIRLLKRYSHNVIMLYDADNAGQMATLRSLELLIEEDITVKVISLPKGYDPDSYIRSFSAGKFKELVNQAKDIFEYKLQMLTGRYSPLSIAHKAKIVQEMLPTISKFKNMVLQSAYLRRLAEELKIDEASLLVEMKKNKGSTAGFALKPLLTSLPTERLLVKLMLEEEDLVQSLKEKISPLDFQDKNLSQIVERIFRLFYEGKRIDAKNLLNDFSDSSLSKVICELTASEGPVVVDRQRIISDCIKRLKDDVRKLRQQEIYAKIKAAEAAKDESRLKGLLEEFQCLSRKEG